MSKSFSLTHPPAPPAPKRNGTNEHWRQESITRWLDCQLINHDFDACIVASRKVSERLLKSDAWFRAHGDDHPKSDEARRLQNKLINRQGQLLHEMKHLYVKLWLEVCGLHGALNLVDDAEDWLAENAPEITRNSPETIWHVLQPNRSPPFTTHPPPVEAYYVEHGFETQEALNAWMHRRQE